MICNKCHALPEGMHYLRCSSNIIAFRLATYGPFGPGFNPFAGREPEGAAPSALDMRAFEKWALEDPVGIEAFETMKRVNDKAAAIDKLHALWEKFEFVKR